MGIVKNKDGISGTVGNLVFYEQGNKLLVRSHPYRVKQTANTKKAASQFGFVSASDRRFRQKLLHRVPLHTDKTYAYRHRTVFGKMCGRETIDEKTVFSFAHGNPKTLEGFDFNLESPWEKRCHFFPEFGVNEAGVFSIHIPALRMGKEIKNHTGAIKAVLDFWLVSAVPPQPNHAQINLLWNESFEVVSGQAHPPVGREIPDCPADEWLLVLASCRYEFNQSFRLSQNPNKFPQPASTYLWGVGER